MYTAIKETAKQFGFKPKIANVDKLFQASKYVLVGMGGSHLAANLLQIIKPELDIIIHSNYGLPIIFDLKERLIILSSYSGDTEEVLDAYQKAGRLGLNRAVISIGGALLDQAKRDGVPYLKMPDFGLQPRLALPLNLISLLKLMNEEKLIAQASELEHGFTPENFEKEGKTLASMIHGYVPIVYASVRNQPLAYNWKIKLNETGKIPAFYNVFSELNHNEMTGFDVKDSTRELSEIFYFLFLSDAEDLPKIQKRMTITAKLYQDRNLLVHEIKLSGKNIFYKIFNSLVLADWTANYTAEGYGLESEKVPMIEEFKKLIKE